MKEIIYNGLENGNVKLSESYLKLKPWVYGVVKTEAVIAIWLDIAREKSSNNSNNKLIFNMVIIFILLSCFIVLFFLYC